MRLAICLIALVFYTASAVPVSNDAADMKEIGAGLTEVANKVVADESFQKELAKNIEKARSLSNPLAGAKKGGRSPWKYSFDYHLSKSKKYLQEFDFFVGKLSPVYQKQVQGFKYALKFEFHLQFHGWKLSQISFGIKGNLGGRHHDSHSDSDSSDSDSSDSDSSDSDCSDSDSSDSSDSSSSEEHH